MKQNQVYETVLSAERVDEIEEWVNDLEIDPSDLPSYHYDKNPYGLEYPLYCGSGQYDWDEDEEYEAKCEKAVDYLESDGVEGYFDVEDDELTLFDARDDELVDEFIRIVEALRDGKEIKTKGE